MTLVSDIAQKLSQFKEQFAVYGPHAANLYRHEPRAVEELSFALALGSAKKSKKHADQILEEIGYTLSYQWLEGLQSKTGKAVSVVVGSPPEGNPSLPLTFYIPSLPWVSKGVRRAQGSEQDVEGTSLPIIPVDDLIVAKAHALTLDPKQPIELDDLASIFQSETELDIPYIMGEFNLLDLKLPGSLEPHTPEELKKYLA